MEWLIGIYLVVGIVKAFGFAFNPEVALRPIWAMDNSNLIVKLIMFCVVVILWPFIRKPG